MKTVWRVFAYVKRYPWLAAGMLSCAIIGTLKFIACHRTEDRTPNEWGNYEPGRFAWETSDQRLLPAPVPCIGRQGIFDWKPFPSTP